VNLRRKKPGAQFYVFGAIAAEIIGESRDAYRRKYRDNKYPSIRGRNLRWGNQYSLRDVLEHKYPGKSKKEIDELVYNWQVKLSPSGKSRAHNRKRGRK